MFNIFRRAPEQTEADEERERGELKRALSAISMVLDGHVKDAKAMLGDRSKLDVFGLMSLSLMEWFDAAAGMEPALARRANDLLDQTTSMAQQLSRKTYPESITSRRIYPPGSEYTLIIALSRLLSAVLGFLSESMVEIVKSINKIYKANHSLQKLSKLVLNANIKEKNRRASIISHESISDIDDDQIDRLESLDSPSTNNITREKSSRRNRKASMNDDEPLNIPPIPSLEEYPADYIIHTGVVTCVGLLSLMISHIPPSMSRYLSLFGFSGNRSQALQMLWSSSHDSGIFGTFALLTLMSFYNLSAEAADIRVPWPKADAVESLNAMKQRYPNNPLWDLEIAKLLVREKNITKAKQILENTSEPEIHPVKGLILFELIVIHTVNHDYEAIAENISLLLKENDWSEGFYHYFMASAYTELWRKTNNPEIAKLATEHFLTAPTLVKKKSITGKSIPIELYLTRKVKKFRLMGDDFVKSIQGSPLEEIGYFFGWFHLMDKENIAISKQNIQYGFGKEAVTGDNELSRDFLLTVIEKFEENFDVALDMMDTKVIPLEQKVNLRDPLAEAWLTGAICYERAILEFKVHGLKESKNIQSMLKRAGNNLSDEADQRLMFRITAAKNNLRALEKIEN